MNHGRVPKRAAGFTLVELMVAIVVSLILLVGVLHIMLSNRQSLRAQRALSGLQSRAHLLSVVLDNSVASAGYRVNPKLDRSQAFPAQNVGGGINLAAGQVVTGAAQAGGDVSLQMRIQSNGGLHDCLGRPIGDDANPDTSVFALRFNQATDTINCTVYTPKRDNGPVISGVQKMVVAYGVRNGNNTSYVIAAPANPANKIVSVRVQALLRTQPRVLSSPIDRTFNFVNGDAVNLDNRRAHLMLDRTIAIRNNLP